MRATIIIPNINGKGWLKDSIESILAQTVQDFHLIVVDNGSTDESLDEARSYCGRPNFTLIENDILVFLWNFAFQQFIHLFDSL